MLDESFTVEDVIAAETAATEASIIAEKLRSAGAWFAGAAATEVAKARRAKADRIRAQVSRRLVAA